MLEHITYYGIRRIDPEHAARFMPGDEIVIEEKIDGANASFQYDEQGDILAAFSHHHPLDADNDLRGFYGFVQSLDKDKVKEVLGSNIRLFGEWLVQHKVKYPEERYNKFYCFDALDTVNNRYLPQREVMKIAEKLELPFVPVLFEGVFTNWNDYASLVGKTMLGGTEGEGIVIKNMSRLDTIHLGYIKIVQDRFKEFKAKRPHKKHLNESSNSLAATIVTRARVEKLLLKLVDEGILPENWSIKDMDTIRKNIPKRIYKDCVKEENDTVQQCEDFGKHANKLSINFVKEIISEKTGVNSIL
ncbi:MAG: hypothetical protein E7478_01705 [Ruminococcaceae bacterium]|nr:hypothetical protein [Oscillospiraceae bacterium]